MKKEAKKEIKSKFLMNYLKNIVGGTDKTEKGELDPLLGQDLELVNWDNYLEQLLSDTPDEELPVLCLRMFADIVEKRASMAKKILKKEQVRTTQRDFIYPNDKRFTYVSK